LSARNIQNGHIDWSEAYSYISEEDYLTIQRTNPINEGDVLLTIVGSIGRSSVNRTSERFTVQRSVAIARPNKRAIIPDYLSLLFRGPDFQSSLQDLASGTAQKGVYLGALKRIPIPLAPINEQCRIVAKLEKLLTHVDAAQVLLASVPRILKRLRQSILAAACSGELTADWRKENKHLSSAADLLVDFTNEKKAKRAGRLWGAGVVPDLTDEERNSLPETWTWTKVRNLGEDPLVTVQVGPMSMQSKSFRSHGVPVLNVGCVQWGEFDESKLNYLPTEEAAAFDRYRIAADDILFTRSGTVGRCAIAGRQQNGYLMTFHLLRVRLTRSRCLPKYLQFVFQGAPHIQRQTSEGAIGSTRAGFNTNLLANLDVPLPPLTEQQEIVCRVEALVKSANALEARYRKAKAHVDRLTQSILAKAFRGELVPQDPSDEPASVLLESIREARNISAHIKTERDANAG
jgi:type I restriction enzyme S subunit